jgi:hypothetical protein
VAAILAAAFFGAAFLVTLAVVADFLGAAFLMAVVFFLGFGAGAEVVAVVVGLGVLYGLEDAAVRSTVFFVGTMMVCNSAGDCVSGSSESRKNMSE